MSKKGDSGGLTVKWLPESTLNVNEAYQRKLNKAHIEKIIANFNPRLVDPLRIYVTSEGNEVIDGQHTLEVLRQMGWKSVPVFVLNGKTDTTEAANLFVIRNTGRKSLRPLEIFKADLAAKNPRALAINEVVTSFDLRVASGVPTGIGAVKRLETIYIEGGDRALRDVLYVITEAWDADERDRFHGHILHGMHLLISREKADLEKLAIKLKRTSPVDVLRKAHALSGHHGGGGSSAPFAVENELRKAIRRRRV